MANLNRSAKPSCDWNQCDLNTYNIRIQFEDGATFFGDSNLPLPIIDEELLTTLEAEDMLSDHNAELIHLLDLAMMHQFYGGSAVDDFAVELLRQLGYVKRNRVAHTQKDILYFICGEWRHAKPDICLLNCLQDHDILLLIQEDTPFLPEDLFCLRDPQARLIANAIAAFGEKLEMGQDATIEPKACGSSYFSGVLHSLAMKIMPGIMLTGTMPIFYKIPVTLNLLHNVWHGTYPSEPMSRLNGSCRST
jgi:hypothetical protein